MGITYPGTMERRVSSCLAKYAILIDVHRAGDRVAMNLKSLLQPTIDKIRAEVREEERAKNTKIFESWLQHQVRSGKITLHECLELPAFGGNYPRKYITVSGEIREF